MIAGSRVIQVRNPKDGVVRERALRLDEFAAPFTIGTEGDLQLEDDACLPIEAKAYFDGSTLFIASADPTRLVIVNKTLVGRLWMAVPCPSILELGSSRLIYDDAHDLGPSHDKSAVRALRWQVKAPQLATLGEERSSQSPVLTLVTPSPRESWDSATQAFDWSSLQPSLGAAAAAAEPVFSQEAPIAEPSAPPPRTPVARRVYERVRQEFVRTPRSMRLAFFSLPVLAMFVLTQRSEHAHAEAKVPAPSASAAEAARTTPSSAAIAAGGEELPPVARPAPAATENTSTTKPSLQRSLEARAADAASRGALTEAIDLYDKLAAQHPERSEFRSVQRILVARVSALAEHHSD